MRAGVFWYNENDSNRYGDKWFTEAGLLNKLLITSPTTIVAFLPVDQAGYLKKIIEKCCMTTMYVLFLNQENVELKVTILNADKIIFDKKVLMKKIKGLTH